MERVLERLAIAKQALSTLRELALLSEPTAVERDAAIQRFEYTFEATWQAARAFLLEREGLECGSPKSAVRASREVGLLNDAESVLGLELVDDRNRTVHTYNEALAQRIFARLPEYVALLGTWLDQMVTELSGESARPSTAVEGE